jgi:tetratricopeptide (TPR) repeat protein
VCADAADLAGNAPLTAVARAAHQKQDAGDLAGAEAIWREALQSAEEKPAADQKLIAELRSILASVLHLEGRDREAYPLALNAVKMAEVSGNTLLIAPALTRLGLILADEGEFARAEPLLHRSLALFEQSEGGEALDTAIAENNLAMLYLGTARYATAEQLQNRALPVYEKRVDPEDPSLAAALANMFTILFAQGRAEQGEPYLRRALAIGETRFPGTAAMARLQVCLAVLEFSRGHYQESARILQAAIGVQEQMLGPNHPELARSLVFYSAVLRHLRNKTEARQAEIRAKMILKRNSFR